MNNNKQFFISIAGFSGSGKSTMAKKLQEYLQDNNIDAILLRSDVIRKELWGVDIHEKLPEAAYEWSFTEKVIKETEDRIKIAKKNGQTIITDKLSITKNARNEDEALAKELKLEFIGFWLDVDEKILEQRVNDRTGDASDATVDILRNQLKIDLAKIGKISWNRIDGNSSIEDNFKPIEQLMNKKLSPIKTKVNFSLKK